jgi:hypothetical protein
MTISKLVKQLQEIHDKQGDLEVLATDDAGGWCSIEKVIDSALLYKKKVVVLDVGAVK